MAEEKRRPGRPKSDGPVKEKRVTFRMSYPEYERLKEFSEKQGLTVAATISRAIDYYYRSQK